ncbi:MAG: OmpA family protein [Bacteroidales bacterium]|nr:OmpA family protein [Bacteroidales bacterium]
MENENLNNPENVQDPELNKVEKNKQITKKKNLSSKEKKAQKTEMKAQKLATKKEKQEQKIAARSSKNTRWFYFFILLLVAIVLLSLWDNYRRYKVSKSEKHQLDSLRYSEVFYKSKYHEKDSSLNILLSNYNMLLQQTIDNSKELTTNKYELMRLQKIVYMQDSILRQVQSTIDVALSGYQSDEVVVEMREGKLYITMRNKLLFPSGSSIIQPKGMTALSTLSKILIENPNIDITVEGHTDNVPLNPKDKNYTDNWDLSTARAVSVTRLLTDKYGIRPERISAAGRSMYYPIAPNTTVDGRAKNRRIEIILTPNLEELYKLVEGENNAQ